MLQTLTYIRSSFFDDVTICSETFKSVCRAPVEIDNDAGNELAKAKSEVGSVVTSRDQWLHLRDSNGRVLTRLSVPSAGGEWAGEAGAEDPVSPGLRRRRPPGAQARCPPPPAPQSHSITAARRP